MTPNCCVVCIRSRYQVPDTVGGMTTLTRPKSPYHSPPDPRQPVLFDDPETVAARLRAKPGTWFLVAGGELDRTRSFQQAAIRIRNGETTAFRDGKYEATVSADQSIPDRDFPVELFARYVA